MKPYIYCLLLAVFAIPVASNAQNPYFSDQGNLRVDFRIDYVPLRENASESLRSLFVPSYKEVPIYYQFNEFIGEPGEGQTEESAARFREAVTTKQTYLQIWRGTPHSRPTLLWQRDISGTHAGVHMYRFPFSNAEYFVMTVMTDSACAINTCVNEFFEESRGSHQQPFAYDGFSFHINEEFTLYSNLLFLPGIKGSRLYAGELCSDDSCKEKLWEPNSDADVQKLFLAEDGSSVRTDIFATTGDVIDRVLLTDIYSSFIQHLNDMEDSMLVLDYEALAYDWRLSLPDLITKGVEIDDRIYYASSTPNPALRESLKRLYTLTKSGKVSIIAHSNGGLLAKALVQFLGDAEAERLIDKIVLIGVPQAGAPQALGALLFGYREGIPWRLPFIVSPSVARSFGENAPMAYHLLPTDALFRLTSTPIVSFAAEHTYSPERAAYGSTLDSFEELADFLLAKEGGRSKPTSSNTKEPNVLNSNLLTYAATLHQNLDSWIPPAGIDVYQVVGWGVETMSGLQFYEDCVLSVCTPKYRPLFNEAGDGVVPSESAHLMQESENVHTYWVDLREHQSVLQKRDHGTLLEIPEVRDLVEKIVASTSDELPRTISRTEPVPSTTKKFRLFLHSPLELQVTDSSGNYTGPNPDGSWSEQIPGSEYGVFGEVQFITIPADSYQVFLDGYEAGSFTLEIQELVGDEVIGEVKFIEVPTTENTEVRLNLDTDVSEVETLHIDTNGDGEIDFQVSPSVESVASPATSSESVPSITNTSVTQPDGRVASSTAHDVTETEIEHSPNSVIQKDDSYVPETKDNLSASSHEEDVPQPHESWSTKLLSLLTKILKSLTLWLQKFSSSLLFGMSA